MTFETFSSRAVRIPRKDIDTDLIIPAKYLKGTDMSGLGDGCFAEFRRDPLFPMNRTEFRNAQIVVSGANFGCGSSREHAPWALVQSGFSVVISSEFADIFRGNAEKNGLLPIVLPEDVVQRLLHPKDEYEEITVNLSDELVSVNKETWKFYISPFSKKRLLEGLSDTDYLAQFEKEIRKKEGARKPFLPLVSRAQ
ncbi:3-isopropylmalate dehydratase small subunit [Candidatus Peregrinibacteria bacterium]|nr:MAG: 3-isopropylmalate dehydratase small subunit [Candidatus Peregrinibacteria bacterium]